MTDTNTAARVKMATAGHATIDEDDIIKSTVSVQFSDADGIEAHYELDMLAAAMLQMTLGFAMQPLKPLIEKERARKSAIPDTPEGI